MRAALIALALFSSIPTSFGQELIPNPSFEQYSCCPVGPGELPCAEQWTVPSLGTPDYFNSCATSTSVDVPVNAVGMQDAYHGEAYGAFFALADLPVGYREYLQSPLIGSGLEADKTYRFTMQLSLAEDSSVATDRIGAHFSTTPITTGDWFELPVTPQVESPAGTFLTDTVEWMEVSGTFVADGGEQVVTIGNFHDATDAASIPAGFGPDPPLQLGSGYYYVDMASLQCQECIHPPDDLVAWWPLDEPTGPVVSDIVYGLNGTLVGSPSSVPGYVNSSFEYAGNGISVPTASELEHDDGDFSMVAWVRVDALGTTQVLFSKSPPLFSGAGYAIFVNPDGTIGFVMVDDALDSVTANSSDALTAGEWSLVIVGVDRSEVDGGTIWVDGVPTTFDPTGAPGSLTNALPLAFAQDGGSGAGADLVGGLDEVQVYNRALQAIEVPYVLESRTSGQCKIFLELEPVIGIPFTPGPLPTITTSGNLTNGTDTPGTFSATVRGEPAGTRFGRRVSTVDGPTFASVTSQQLLQLRPDGMGEVRLELENPRELGGGLACYSVTVTHHETGRTYRFYGGLRGRRVRQDLAPR